MYRPPPTTAIDDTHTPVDAAPPACDSDSSSSWEHVAPPGTESDGVEGVDPTAPIPSPTAPIDGVEDVERVPTPPIPALPPPPLPAVMPSPPPVSVRVEGLIRAESPQSPDSSDGEKDGTLPGVGKPPVFSTQWGSLFDGAHQTSKTAILASLSSLRRRSVLQVLTV